MRIIDANDPDAVRSLESSDFGEPGAVEVITSEMISRYAKESGDYNPLHTDEMVAKAGPFGAIVAHGDLVLQKLPMIRPTPDYCFDRVGQPIRRNGRQNYRGPVYVGDGIYGHERVRKTRVVRNRLAIVVIAYEVLTTDGKKVMDGSIELAYPILRETKEAQPP